MREQTRSSRQQPRQPQQPDEPTPAQAAAVATILAGAGAAGATAATAGAGVLAALLALMVPWGYSRRVIRVAVTLTTRTAGPRAGEGPAGRATTEREPTFSAWFLLNAARRIEQRLAEGKPLDEAVRPERRYLEQRQQAGRARAAAARAVDDMAEKLGGNRLGRTYKGQAPITVDGRRVLMWRAYADDKVTVECRAADGHWFYVDTPPVIGYPGMPHGGTCRCWPAAATSAVLRRGSVDDAVRSALGGAPDRRETFPNPARRQEAEAS